MLINGALAGGLHDNIVGVPAIPAASIRGEYDVRSGTPVHCDICNAHQPSFRACMCKYLPSNIHLTQRCSGMADPGHV